MRFTSREIRGKKKKKKNKRQTKNNLSLKHELQVVSFSVLPCPPTNLQPPAKDEPAPTGVINSHSQPGQPW